MIIYQILILAFIYFAQAIGIYEIAKRRGIKNTWLSFIPFGQQFLLGAILDNISAYKYKKTNYRFLLLGIIILGYSLTYVGNNTLTLMAIVTNIYLLLLKFVYFFIYKDYTPKHAFTFILLSVIISCEFVFIFMLRKNVPVSMCFSMQDEWQFEVNQPRLQILWNEYHSSPQMQSWSEFLTANFVPISQL